MLTRQQVEETGKAGIAVEAHPLGEQCRMLNRFWLVADPEDHGFTPHARNDGFWEAWITVWMVREMSRGVAFADVGANMGYYGLLACALDCPTYFFEPQVTLAERIGASIAANRFHELAQVSHCAVGAGHTSAVFTVPKHHGMLATYAYDVKSPDHANEEYTQYAVTVRPLDTLLEDWQTDRPLLIKIDVEGAEPHTWAGMQEIWESRKPTAILEFRADRYLDPVGFASKLLAAGTVSYVNEAGAEVPVTTHETLTSQPHHDWMVVVRHPEQRMDV
jgi:FkbM family methyltransferase